ncbi:hypothetical protein H8356DRAFT_1708775 [Neocallimastix lanati (nom. inval.)]|jgi:hypothetical protein|nr:hypothetical protein H8356DRAFT_1708775 [Neocallimastix sp. JGI-2020a]
MLVTPEDYAKSFNITEYVQEVEKYNQAFLDNANLQSKFISDPSKASVADWLFSRGTSYECFIQDVMLKDEVGQLDSTINTIRLIIYAFAKPLQSQFFYWTLLLLILHKFNFRKPVMKLILAHYILRVVGDILEQIGPLMGSYYYKDDSGACKGSDVSVEYHPLRWLLTRQIGNIFWYGGEIAGDWYPLLRTRAVAREQKSIWFVYITCGLFNLSKIALIILHWTELPTRLYKDNGAFDEDKKNRFYNIYWAFQGFVILSSFIYDLTVYLVLKRQIFNRSKASFGFLKKFRSISEYRMAISAFIGVIGLPIVSVTLIYKYYYLFRDSEKYSNLNFSFEDVRLLISNVQYYMIFIDQILLFRSRDGSSLGETTSVTTGGPYSSNNFSSNNLSTPAKISKPVNINSKLYYTNLNSLNNNTNTLVNSQTSLLHYGKPKINIGRNNSYENYGKNNNISNYDDYNPNMGNEWTYLRK